MDSDEEVDNAMSVYGPSDGCSLSICRGVGVVEVIWQEIAKPFIERVLAFFRPGVSTSSDG